MKTDLQCLQTSSNEPANKGITETRTKDSTESPTEGNGGGSTEGTPQAPTESTTEPLTEGDALKTEVAPETAQGSALPPTSKILYEVRYFNSDHEEIYSRSLPKPLQDIEASAYDGEEPPVLRVIYPRQTWLAAESKEFVDPSPEREGKINLPRFRWKFATEINILSPALKEILRSAVDYYPGLELDNDKPRFYWPYPALVHCDKALEEFQVEFEKQNCADSACLGHYAHRHLETARNLWRQDIGAAVDQERERNSRGLVTFDMLWLMLQPGEDAVFDFTGANELEPCILGEVEKLYQNGRIASYRVKVWQIDCDTVDVGPRSYSYTQSVFSGEKEITSLVVYPLKYMKKDKHGRDQEQLKADMIERGKLFYELQKKGCWDFQGYTQDIPRRPVGAMKCLEIPGAEYV